MPQSVSGDWRQAIGALDRYSNIEKLKQSIISNGLSSTGHAHKTAVDLEQEAYNTSHTREDYDTACTASASGATSSRPPEEVLHGDAVTIGKYPACHHIASGVVSEVYRSGSIALKVITETHNVEPHDAHREVKLLEQYRHAAIIRLQESFRDARNQLVLVFPYTPLTLAKVIERGFVPLATIKQCFRCLCDALSFLHGHGIIHRDIKPSNLLLEADDGPAYLSDFGTAWHPEWSRANEPANNKILDVGTTCYRAPEALFGRKNYGTSMDMWATGTMLAECLRQPAKELFESREANEDGNQLGLILSIFKTLGTPTPETWPEALHFTTPPFEWYRHFEAQSWESLMPGVDGEGLDLVRRLVRYESGSRLEAKEAS